MNLPKHTHRPIACTCGANQTETPQVPTAIEMGPGDAQSPGTPEPANVDEPALARDPAERMIETERQPAEPSRSAPQFDGLVLELLEGAEADAERSGVAEPGLVHIVYAFSRMITAAPCLDAVQVPASALRRHLRVGIANASELRQRGLLLSGQAEHRAIGMLLQHAVDRATQRRPARPVIQLEDLADGLASGAVAHPVLDFVMDLSGVESPRRATGPSAIDQDGGGSRLIAQSVASAAVDDLESAPHEVDEWEATVEVVTSADRDDYGVSMEVENGAIDGDALGLKTDPDLLEGGVRQLIGQVAALREEQGQRAARFEAQFDARLSGLETAIARLTDAIERLADGRQTPMSLRSQAAGEARDDDRDSGATSQYEAAHQAAAASEACADNDMACDDADAVWRQQSGTAGRAENQPQDLSQDQSQRDDRFYLEIDDDIVEAPSIGPRTAERFRAIGIRSVRDFLSAEPDDLAADLATPHLNADLIADMQDQCGLMLMVPQLRVTHAQLLVGAGYRTVTDLQVADLADVQADVLRFAVSNAGQRYLRDGTPPPAERIQAWVENAHRADVRRAR